MQKANLYLEFYRCFVSVNKRGRFVEFEVEYNKCHFNETLELDHGK